APAGVRAPRAGLPGAELRQERARGPDLEADRARSQAPAVPAWRSLLSGGLRSPRAGGPEPGVVRTGVDAEAQRAGQPGRVVPPDFRLVPQLFLGRFLADRHHRDRQVADVEVADRLVEPLGDPDLDLDAELPPSEHPHLVAP